jgi:branched-chain amino acid transport system substrate-binding protein
MGKPQATSLGLRTRTAVAIVLATATGAGALALGSSAGAASSSIKIAVEGPMTGAQASTGIDMLHGAQLAASALNAQGGVSGHQITIVKADDRADPSTGVKVAHQMVSQGVSAVIGPFNSSVGVKNLPIYRSAGVTILRLTSATSTEGYGVTTQPMVTQIAPVEADELHSVLHAGSVDILFDPSTYTAGIASQLRSLLRSDGVSVPLYRSVSPTATSSQRTAVLNAVASSHSDVTYMAMYGPQAGLMAKGLYELTSTTTSATPPGRCFVDLAAQGADFVSAAGVTAAEACLNSGVPSATQLPDGAAYVSAYQDQFHTAPGTWGAFTYDSLDLYAAEAKSSGQVKGQQLRSALSHASDFSGATGTITIEPGSGNRRNPPVVILDIDSSGQYVIDPTWAQSAGYQVPSS